MIQWGDGKTIEDPVFRCHLSCHGTGNGRQDIVQDDADRGGGWLAWSVPLGGRDGRCMPLFLTNHLHLVLKTPRPNLAKGMQLFLSSYANGWGRRHRHCGHLFQGRYRTELVEDETYLWALTRYVHLNPVRLGLAVMPGAGMWSSRPGYFRRRNRLDWVAYYALLAAGPASSDGPSGGILPSLRGGRSDYPACPPWAEALHGWLLGSERFLDRLRHAPRRSGPSRRAGSDACFED